MKLSAESTTKIVTLHTSERGDVPARIWEAVTEDGVRCGSASSSKYEPQRYRANFRGRRCVLPSFEDRYGVEVLYLVFIDNDARGSLLRKKLSEVTHGLADTGSV